MSISLVLFLLGAAAVALEFLSGSFILLAAGLALFIMAGLEWLSPLELGTTLLVGSVLWLLLTLELRWLFSAASAPPDPNDYVSAARQEDAPEQRSD